MKAQALFGWALGSFTSAALVGAVSLLHLRFMTDSLGVAIGLAGLLVVASKIYDALLDPLMGMFSDRTRTRWGRYRPWLAAGGVLAGVSLAMLFNVPQGLDAKGIIVWSGVSLLVFSTAYTMFRIPYLALGRAITQDFHERSRLMTYSVYGSSLGSLAATSAAPFMLARLGGGRAAHGELAMVLAVLVALGAVATFLLIDREGNTSEPPAQHKFSFAEAWRAIADNRPFRGLVGFKVTLFTGLTLHGAALPFYTRHVLRASDVNLSSIYLAQTLATIISQRAWVGIAARIGRRRALMLAALLQAAVMLGWVLVPVASPSPWVQILGAAEGLCIGGLIFGLYSILTDTMDHARDLSGKEGREGVLAGVFVMVEKGTAALGTYIFSAVLAWAGFVSASNVGSLQSPEVVKSIIIAMSVLPALGAVFACLFLRERAMRLGPVLAAVLVMAMGLTLTLTPERAVAKDVSAGLVIQRIVSGPDGKSRLENFALPRPAGLDPAALVSRLYSTDVEIGESRPGTFIDWHRVSTPRLLVILAGEMEVGTGDGRRHRLRPGAMVLAMDTEGQGHTSRTVGRMAVRAMTIRLPLDDPLRTRASSCPDGMAAQDCVANSLKIERH